MALDHSTQMKALYMFMGTITGVHKNLDALRDHREAPGESAINRTPVDHNIEQAQISLEVAMMRLQQVVALIDPDVCTTTAPPCSDERGPCQKHEATT